VTSVNRAPKKYQPGTEGEVKDLELELKTVADVGLVGYPNAGKSTLLRALSAARPKTAPYPFTTLHPSVGIIDMEDFYRFSVADIPGLIEGASENVGLGHAFLRHIERCRLFCFVLDMAGVDGRDPLADLASLRDELKKYEPGLEKRPFVLVANKMDLEGSEANLARLKEAEPNSMIIPVCAELAENTDELIRRLRTCLETLPPMDAEDLNRILAKRRVFLNDKTQAKAKDDDDWDY
jgi:GTP-binding protein